MAESKDRINKNKQPYKYIFNKLVTFYEVQNPKYEEEFRTRRGKRIDELAVEKEIESLLKDLEISTLDSVRISSLSTITKVIREYKKDGEKKKKPNLDTALTEAISKMWNVNFSDDDKHEKGKHEEEKGVDLKKNNIKRIIKLIIKKELDYDDKKAESLVKEGTDSAKKKSKIDRRGDYLSESTDSASENTYSSIEEEYSEYSADSDLGKGDFANYFKKRHLGRLNAILNEKFEGEKILDKLSIPENPKEVENIAKDLFKFFGNKLSRRISLIVLARKMKEIFDTVDERYEKLDVMNCPIDLYSDKSEDSKEFELFQWLNKVSQNEEEISEYLSEKEKTQFVSLVNNFENNQTLEDLVGFDMEIAPYEYGKPENQRGLVEWFAKILENSEGVKEYLYEEEQDDLEKILDRVKDYIQNSFWHSESFINKYNELFNIYEMKVYIEIVDDILSYDDNYDDKKVKNGEGSPRYKRYKKYIELSKKFEKEGNTILSRYIIGALNLRCFDSIQKNVEEKLSKDAEKEYYDNDEYIKKSTGDLLFKGQSDRAWLTLYENSRPELKVSHILGFIYNMTDRAKGSKHDATRAVNYATILLLMAGHNKELKKYRLSKKYTLKESETIEYCNARLEYKKYNKKEKMIESLKKLMIEEKKKKKKERPENYREKAIIDFFFKKPGKLKQMLKSGDLHIAKDEVVNMLIIDIRKLFSDTRIMKKNTKEKVDEILGKVYIDFVQEIINMRNELTKNKGSKKDKDSTELKKYREQDKDLEEIQESIEKIIVISKAHDFDSAFRKKPKPKKPKKR